METKIIDYPKGTTDYSIGDIVFLNFTKKNKVKFIGLDEKGSFLYEPIENTDYFINEKGLIHFTKKVKVYNKEIKMERKDSIEIPIWVLKEIENTLNNQDIESEIFWLGNKPISGCLGCGSCLKTGKCFINDKVNEFLDKVKEADGFIFGTPVHLCPKNPR